jgi:hypothetical protein
MNKKVSIGEYSDGHRYESILANIMQKRKIVDPNRRIIDSIGWQKTRSRYSQLIT